MLMEEAERIAREEHGSVKIAVISGKIEHFLGDESIHDHGYYAGVGTRDYYRRLGYELDGPYMSKSLI